jgi:hypothetical protein
MHAQWDKTLLPVELAGLRDQGVDLGLMGFAAEDAILAAFGRGEDAWRAMRRSTVRQMRVDRVDAAMAIRPYMVLALKREFLSSVFDQQLPSKWSQRRSYS